MKYGERIGFLIVLLVLAMPSSAQSGNARLHPSSDYWDKDARHVAVHISDISKSRRLASVGDSLYMLDRQNRIVWTWSSRGAPLSDLPIVDSKGTIYVIGTDLTWAALDSKTGEEKWRGTANGRAFYSQIKLYKTDMYFVVIDMEGYRDSLRDKTIEDKLNLCKGNSILWETNIPARSRLEVGGSRVLVIYKKNHHTVRRSVRVPKHFAKPIGKVSSLADYGL